MEKEYEYLEWIKCMGSVSPDGYNVIHDLCPRKFVDHAIMNGFSEACQDCPAIKEWKRINEQYEEMLRRDKFGTSGKVPSEAIFLTNHYFGIRSAYMANGEIREWCKKYAPKRYKEILKREQALIDHVGNRTKIDQTDQIPGQMNIFDFI